MQKPNQADEMLHQMVQELSSADLSAIRKARGFSKEEASSRAVFETFFLSAIGVEQALAALAEAEIATLYLMSQLEGAVEIGFFTRLYGDASGEEKYYYGTPTQKYRETFEKVHKNLFRRGLLLMVQAHENIPTSRMERWRFLFPLEFHKFLPHLVQAPVKIDPPGEARTDVLRKKVLEIISGPFPDPLANRHAYRLHIAGKQLYLGTQPFQTKGLLEWQQACWAAAAKITNRAAAEAVAPLEAVTSILAQLGPGEWLLPEQLTGALKVLCYGFQIPKPEQLCAAGWQWGCLTRRTQGHKTYYRLAPWLTPENVPGESEAPEDYIRLKVAFPGIAIDLSKIPYEALARLGQVSNLQLVNGELIASPNQIKIGRLNPETCEEPFLKWLVKASPLYRKAFETMRSRWGRQIVHSGLMVARVKDLSLKVQIERAFTNSGEVVALSDEFLAFPVSALEEIEKTIKKAGFVIKRVKAK